MVEETILRCLTQVPFPVGKSGLAKILKGAAGSPIGPERSAEYAALNTMTSAAIEAAIELMVEQGRLRRSSGRIQACHRKTAEVGVCDERARHRVSEAG